jgi:hypothetical protein
MTEAALGKLCFNASSPNDWPAAAVATFLNVGIITADKFFGLRTNDNAKYCFKFKSSEISF